MADHCIYPGPHWGTSEEHYLPAALGKFQGYESLLGRLCGACNKKIGDAVETEFLRAGPIAFFRWMVGIKGRDGLLPSPFYRGAAGVPPLYMLGRAPNFPYDLLWEVHPGTQDVYPLRQVVFEHPLAGTHAVPILDRMRGQPEVLIEHLRERGLERARPVHAFATPEEIPWISDLLRVVGYVPPGDWVTTEFPAQKIPLVVTVTVTPAHFRAVAKIAFHYALKMFPDLSGMEPEFAAIKDFIWTGGDVDQFVRQRQDQFVENFRRGEPTQWMHILAVERTYNGILGHAQFFAGPQTLPPPYLIRIGRDPARVVRPVERHAHQFVILDPASATGVMVDAEPLQYIRPP